MCLLQFKYLGKRRLANGDGCGPAGRASTLPPRVAPPTFNARPLTAYEPDKSILLSHEKSLTATY